MESLKSDKRIDLFGCMDNIGEHGSWYAGGQLEALFYYLDESKIKIISEFMEDDYQGECFAILQHIESGGIIIWRDSFGSCSGCDGLEDQDGYEYIKSTLSEGNTLQFKTIEDARTYVVEDIKSEGWSDWKYMPISMFDELMED